MDADTKSLLAESVRALLESGDDPGTLGWEEVVADDPRDGWEIWFTEQGRIPASTRALDDVVLGRPAGATAVAHPQRYDLRGDALLPTAASGLVLGPLDAVDHVAVPVAGDHRFRLVPIADLRVRPTSSFDGSLTWHTVETVVNTGQLLDLDWIGAVADARRAVAAEILGCAERMLSVAVAHTRDRKQYGQSIASFQAVRHRLAEAHVYITAAHRLLAVADDPWGAAAAKAAAGRAAQAVSVHALQVCGAMGLSDEFVLHRYVARSTVLDALYGGHRQLTTALGRALLDTSEPLPRIAEIV